MCLEDEVTDHNYASCKELLCQQCQDYEAGYVDGKYKALFEVSTQTTDHPPGCGCDTCQAGGGATETTGSLLAPETNRPLVA